MRPLLGALAVVMAIAAPVAAQPADAIGKPLPDASLKDGTVVARLIAGDRTKPVSESELVMTISPQDGSGTSVEKRARTDADGRATFVDVPAASRVKLTAEGADGPVAASPFPMPETGGVRIMVSSIKPPDGGGAMGAPGGPPMTPRAMSGQPRPEQQDDGDTLTVRLSYDDFADPSPPNGHPVVLVDYRWDQIVSAKVVRTDAGGRAVFRGLNKGGSHSYFALTMLPRGDGFDRLISYPVVMPGESGVRLMLSGDKRTIATPVDDLAVLDPQPTGGVPGGEIRVNLLGAAQPGQPVELLDAITGEVLATVKAGPPVAAEGQGQNQPQASARFTGITAGGLDRAFVVRSVDKQPYLSAPFQLMAGRGAAVTLLVVPRVLLQFSLSSWIDDVYLGVRGTFSIQNASWAPYVAGTNDKPEELVVALPKGFKGATVRQDFAEAIGVDPTRGFIIRRPLPPGNTTFIAGFSLEYKGGELTWDMPLPLGSLDSEMEIKRDGTGDTMMVKVPPDVQGVAVREGAAGASKFYILQPITILPGQRMVFRIEGLPRPPAWSRWAKVIVGVIVLIVLAIGTTFALTRPATAARPQGRFEQLLDELAALERDGDGDPARRDTIMAELDTLHRKGGTG